MNKPKTRKNGKAINERNRLALAYLELAGDKVFEKLPDGEKAKLIKDVLAVGEEAAAWVRNEYGTDDPRKIAVKMGLKVFGEENEALARSEYRRDKKEIAISRRFHENLLRKVQSPELSERLLKLVVAHELFHHLEAERLGEVYKRYKFKVFRLGPLAVEKTIAKLSDVAAQSFTQALLGLDLSPQVFDYLVLTTYLGKH